MYAFAGDEVLKNTFANNPFEHFGLHPVPKTPSLV
jgi:hypothetical protein